MTTSDHADGAGDLLTSNDGVRVWCADIGAGEPVLFLHGFSGSSSAAYLLIGRLRDAGLRAIVPDLRGHGYSDKPTSPGDYAIERFADDAAAVLDACGADTAHVVGHCLGGMVATAFALRHPSRVRTLALVGTSLHPAADQRLVAWLQGNARRFLRTPINAALPLDADVPRHVEYATFDDLGDWYWRRMVADYRATSGAAGFAIAEALDSLDLLAQAHAVTAPTLVVHGGRDTVFRPSAATATAEAIPGARLTVLPEDNHVTLVLDPSSRMTDEVLAHIAAAGA